MPSKPPLQLRLVIPQSLGKKGVPLHERALLFFTDRGQSVFLQEKLLRLSPTLPAIIEGEVSVAVFETFLLSFPDIDKMVILTDKIAAKVVLAAA